MLPKLLGEMVSGASCLCRAMPEGTEHQLFVKLERQGSNTAPSPSPPPRFGHLGQTLGEGLHMNLSARAPHWAITVWSLEFFALAEGALLSVRDFGLKVSSWAWGALTHTYSKRNSIGRRGVREAPSEQTKLISHGSSIPHCRVKVRGKRPGDQSSPLSSQLGAWLSRWSS